MITLHDLQQDWNEFICSGIEMECNTSKFDPNKLIEIKNKLNEKIDIYIEETVEMESDKEDAYKSQH